LDCGRVLVVDCETFNPITPDDITSASVHICKMIVHHLVDLFGGSTVTMAGDKSVSFPMNFHPSFFALVRSFMDREFRGLGLVYQAMQLWKGITAAAFVPTIDHQPIFLLDSVEVLCAPLPHAGHHTSGAARSSFSITMASMPQDTAIVWIGTLDTQSSAIPNDASFFVTAPLGGLAALSLDGAKRMRTDWGSALDDVAVSMVWMATCGVPRLLEFAFESRATPWTAVEALTAVKEKASFAYKTATNCTRKLSDSDLTNIVLSCCVGWKTSDGQVDSKGNDVLVPGCDATTWEQLRYNALVFPAADPLRSAIPRYFFTDRIAEMNALCPPGVEMDFLYPDFETILSSCRGATAAGVRWEKLIACAFAARFRVHCLAHNLSLSSYIQLAQLYPSQDANVQAVLAPYDVFLEGGVEYPTSEVFADAPIVNRAVIANTTTASAHHDILLPVARRVDGKKLFIAIQCRYGQKKDAGELTQQMFVKKGSTTEVDVLLQCCSNFEGKQTFKSTSIRGFKEFQGENKYTCISGNVISMTGNLLQMI
jgi:hypothetical protein